MVAGKNADVAYDKQVFAYASRRDALVFIVLSAVVKL